MPIRLKRRQILLLLAAAAVAAVGALVYLNRPAMLTVAVPAQEGEELRLMEAFARALEGERRDVRLTLVRTADAAASAAALEAGRADLAIVRPDAALPQNGMTVAILREEALILVGPASAKIDAAEDLAKRRLGLVARDAADRRFVEEVLRFYDLDTSEVTLVPLEPDAVEAAVRDRRIDAATTVAAPTGPAAAALVNAVARATPERRIALVGTPEAEAMAQRMPALQAVEIPAGVFGGRPRQPAEALQAVGVSRRFMARATLPPEIVARVTGHLFELRSRLARTAPAAATMKAPESVLSATLPVHPGAIQYLERETLTFFERYGDWIYITLFFGGGLFSVAAAIMRAILRKRREVIDEVLDRLACILDEARTVPAQAALDALSGEVDGLVIHAVRQVRRQNKGMRTLSALTLSIDAARSAIADRRRELDGPAVAAEPRMRQARL